MMVNAPPATEGQQAPVEQLQQQPAGGDVGPGHLINDAKVGSEGKLFVGGKTPYHKLGQAEKVERGETLTQILTLYWLDLTDF